MDKREKMALLVEEFALSGQTQKEFSASRGMALAAFNYSLRRLSDKNRGPSSFVRMETGAAGFGAAEQLELVYPNG